MRTARGHAGTHPSVSVVIPTHDRLELVRRAVRSVARQDYDGPVECVVVFDRSEVDRSLTTQGDGMDVRVVSNARSPGLAGARNTGIAAARGDLVAFCDDDDWWEPGKLTAQLRRWSRDPDALVVATGCTIHVGDRLLPRVPRRDRIHLQDLLASRVQDVHPSSLLIDRRAFSEVGDVDESIPGSYGEDRDWLIRAARVSPLAVVQAPLVHVQWQRGSYFADRYDMMISAIDHAIAKHPDLASHAVGRRRLEARRAFALAAQGHRRDARRRAARVLRTTPLEPRALAAMAVASRLVSAESAQRLANHFGRGI